MIGAALIGRTYTWKRAGRYLLVGGLAGGILIAVLGVTGSIPWALVEAGALGGLLAIISIPGAIVVQAKVPGPLRGRVSSAWGGLVGALGPVGALFAGSLAATTSVRTVFVLSGFAIVLVCALGTVGPRELRHLHY
ncbi:MAG: hypothetical protein ACYDFT_00100 [Thermoplasmata archaeon]